LVHKKFKEKFERPTPKPSSVVQLLHEAARGRVWVPIGPEHRRIGRARFERLEPSNIFFWTSPVHFAQGFRSEDRRIRPDEDLVTETRVRVLAFDVLWKVRVWRDGRFRAKELVEVKLAAEAFEPPRPEDVQRFGLAELEE